MLFNQKSYNQISYWKKFSFQGISSVVCLPSMYNEEYLKIKQAVEEKVSSVLTDVKVILQFVLASVIEAIRRNPELYNFVIYDNSNNTPISYGSDYPSLMLSGRRQQQQSFNDSYTAVILEEAEKLYNELTTELTDRVITATTTTTAAAIRASSLPTANNRQILIHKNNAYQTE